MNKTPNFGENVPPLPPIEAFRLLFFLPLPHPHPTLTWKRETLKLGHLQLAAEEEETVSFFKHRKIQFSKSHRLDFGYQ